jgi:VWFA-related protein
VNTSKRPEISLTALFAVALLFSSIAFAQTKPETPVPKINPPPRTTIKTQVRHVLFDVVVIDAKNQPVSGLKRADFSVTEDGAPQNILSFEAHTSAAPSSPVPDPPLDLSTLPVNTFVNVTRERQDLPVNVILYDMLNTPVADQPLALQEIKKFLTNKPSGSHFAIFVLTEKLHLLQGVSDSDAELLAALNTRAAGPHSPVLGAPNPDAVSPGTALADSGVVPSFPGPQAMLDRMKHFEAIEDNYVLQHRVDFTAAAFVDIARFLRDVPGRKNLLWLSGSFPLATLPTGDPIDPFSRIVDFNPILKQTANQLTLSQVAVYPVDVRGLTNASIYDAANNRRYTPAELELDRQKFSRELSVEHSTMDQIAEFTGGHAFYETNGFSQALNSAAEDGSNYYTLSYSPSNTKFDGGLRTIHVKLARTGLHPSYRRNYFADDDFTIAHRITQAPLEKIEAAMQRGAPTDHDLLFSLHAKVVGPPVVANEEQLRNLSQFAPLANLKNRDSLKVQKYELDYALLKKQVTYIVNPDGTRRGSLEFLYAGYDADNNLLYDGTWTGDPIVLPQNSDQARSGMYRAKQFLDIPTNTSWLRLAVRDAVDARLGSLEIPLPLRPE